MVRLVKRLPSSSAMGLYGLAEPMWLSRLPALRGPEGDGTDTPIGTVWIGVKILGKNSVAQSFLFHGNRAEIRQAAAAEAMDQVLAGLANGSSSCGFSLTENEPKGIFTVY